MIEATQEVAGVSLDLLASGVIKLLRLQREIQRSLASEFMATRESAGLLRSTLLMEMALVTATTFLIDLSLGMRPADFPAVRLISYAGVTVLGSWLLWRAVRGTGETSLDAPVTRAGALPYFAGMSPCPLTTIIMVVALANGMVALGLLVSLSMALGMIVTVSLFALATILCRRLLLDLLRRHAVHVERIARGLEVLGAAAVLVIGLLLFSSEII